MYMHASIRHAVVLTAAIVAMVLPGLAHAATYDFPSEPLSTEFTGQFDNGTLSLLGMTWDPDGSGGTSGAFTVSSNGFPSYGLNNYNWGDMSVASFANLNDIDGHTLTVDITAMWRSMSQTDSQTASLSNFGGGPGPGILVNFASPHAFSFFDSATGQTAQFSIDLRHNFVLQGGATYGMYGDASGELVGDSNIVPLPSTAYMAIPILGLLIAGKFWRRRAALEKGGCH